MQLYIRRFRDLWQSARAFSASKMNFVLFPDHMISENRPFVKNGPEKGP